jgi:hypothetical protein
MGWATTKTEVDSSAWGGNGARETIEMVDRGVIFTEEPSAPAGEPEQIDVAAIMDAAPEIETPQPEVLTGEIGGEPTAVPFKKRGRRKDPTKEMLKLAKFGEIAIVCHTLFYRAMHTPEVPCPDLHPEEAQMIGNAVDGYALYLIETSPASAPMIPLAALLLANLIPILNRAPAIVPKTIPFWKKIGEGVSNAWEWIASRFGPVKPSGGKPEKKE